MNNKFMELSFTFVMELYRSKIRAEKDKDINAIASLKIKYPDIFTSEFSEFIESAKLSALYLDQKYEMNYSEMFEFYKEENSKKIH